MKLNKFIKHTFFPAILFLLLFSTCAAAGFKTISRPDPHDPLKAAIYQLDNGLKVYITENHEKPRFYAQVIVRAGSKNDPADTTGLAHYLEHLMFKGTQKLGTLDYEAEKIHLDRIKHLYEKHFREKDPQRRKEIYAGINAESKKAAEYAVPNETDKLYKLMGESGLNAHTGSEGTVYEVDLPANRLEQWAMIESDRFQAPVFRLFHTELETVYEEKNRSMDSKEYIINEAVGRTLYKKHPYGQQTTLGSMEHLKKPSLAAIEKFFKKYYAPNNVAIALSGDLETEATIKVIDRYFSRWKPARRVSSKKWKERPLRGVERVETRYQGEEFVLLAFRTAPHAHADEEALMMLDMVLDNSAAGLINLNLNQQQRVRQSGSYPSIQNDYGAQFLWGIPKEGQSLAEVEELLKEQVAIIKTGRFDAWIIPAIVNDFKKTMKTRLESNEGRVNILSDSFLSLDDWPDTVAEIARLEKVTRADIVRVANKYFGNNYVAGYRKDAPHEVQKIEKPNIDSIAIDPQRQSEFFKKVLQVPVEEIQPTFVDPKKDYQVIREPAGVNYYYAPNPINDLFSFSISVDIGTQHDNLLEPAFLLLDKSGTPDLSAEQLKREWYKLGTDFRAGAAGNETTISLAGLDENFEPSVKLLSQFLNAPTADESTLEELKRIILVQRADMKKDPKVIKDALVQYHRYGKDSDYLTMLPDENVLQLTRDQLHETVQRLLLYKYTVTYVGSLPLDNVLAVVKQYFPDEVFLQDPPPFKYLQVRTPEQMSNDVYLFDKELAQSQVVIEFGGEPYQWRGSPVVELYNNYFGGGMSSIVFQELRESRALAYNAWANYFLGSRAKDQNVFSGIIETQADKTPEALEEFIRLIDDLPDSPERFEDARQSLISRYRTSKLGFRDLLNIVRYWERMGMPEDDPRRVKFAVLLTADKNLMLEFYQKEIAKRRKLISIVGDTRRMDLPRLQSLGDLREVTVEDIFIK